MQRSNLLPEPNGNKTKSGSIHPELPSEDKEGWGGERGWPSPTRPRLCRALSAAGGARRGPRLGPQAPSSSSGRKAAHLAPSGWASIRGEDAALWGQRTFLKGPEHRIFARSHAPGASRRESGMDWSLRSRAWGGRHWGEAWRAAARLRVLGHLSPTP